MPFVPFPDVFPIPEPGPRPRRRRSRCDPAAGASVCSPIRSSVVFAISLLLGFRLRFHRRDLHQVTHAQELATPRRRVGPHVGVLGLPESPRPEHRPHPSGGPDAAPDLRDAHVSLRQRVRLRPLRAARAVPDERPRHAPPPSTSRATGTAGVRPLRPAPGRVSPTPPRPVAPPSPPPPFV